MGDDVTPTESSEWFQLRDQQDAGPPSSGDLRWPTAAPPAPPEPAPPVTPVAAPQREYPRPAAVATLPESGSEGNGWKVRHVPMPDHRPWELAPSLFEAPSAEGTPWDNGAGQRVAARRFVMLGVAVAALVSLVALAITDFAHAPRSITQPSSVGGLTQLNDPQLGAAMQTLQRAVLTAGASNVVDGVYGVNGRAQLVLVVVQGGVNGTSQPGLQSFFNGLATGAIASGWKVDRSHATLTNVGGTPFECSPVTAPTLQGSALSTCAWTDSSAAGVVFDVTGQPMADTLNQAVQARSATEG